MSNKSQISIFIIVGVIFILSSITLLYLNKDEITFFEKTNDPIIEFVEACIYDETRRGINLLMSNGGWLYSENTFYAKRGQSLEDFKKSEGFLLFDKFKQDYWLYFDEKEDSFVLNFPPYDSNSPSSVKNQLASYLLQNLNQNCIQDFSTFRGTYEVDNGDMKIGVSLEDKNIFVTMVMPLSVKEKGTQNERFYTEFKIETPNIIHNPYHLAKDVILTQANTSIIEKNILFILSSYQTYADKNLLPPFYMVSLKHDTQPWFLPNTIETAKRIINSNVGLVGTQNTATRNNFLIPQELQNSEYALGVVKNFVDIRIEDFGKANFRDYQNYKTRAIYETFYPSHISFTGSSNSQFLFPESKSLPLPFIPFYITYYKSNYDMILPITFEIKDKNKRDAVPFVFSLEANIKNNVPLKEAKTLLNPIYLEDEFSQVGEEYTTSKSLICDQSLFLSGNYSLDLYDPIDDKNVKDATIEFDCKGIEVCYIGKTRDEKTTTFNLPLDCSPGTLKISKMGQKTIILDLLNPKEKEDKNFGTIEMPKSKDIEVEIVINDNSGNRLLLDTEEAYLFFTPYDENQEIFVRSVQIKNNTINPKIELIPGKYLIEGKLIDKESFSIPKSEECFDVGFGQEECSEFEGVDIDEFVMGNINTNITFTNKDLKENEIIQIRIDKYDYPKKILDLPNLVSKFEQETSNSSIRLK